MPISSNLKASRDADLMQRWTGPSGQHPSAAGESRTLLCSQQACNHSQSELVIRSVATADSSLPELVFLVFAGLVVPAAGLDDGVLKLV